MSLPNKAAREQMLHKYLPLDRAVNIDYERLASLMEGYSGSDVALVCKEGLMRPVRRLMDKLEKGQIDGSQRMSKSCLVTNIY